MTKEKQEEGSAIEGFSLSGEEVYHMTDKTFTITAEPFYREIPSLNDPEKIDKRLIVPVTLANGTIAEWYANKTSQKSIIAKKGRNLRNWIGYKGEFIVKEQKVGKADKLVIYVKE